MDTDLNGRGQRLPRSERRLQLLEAAQAAFVEQGYHAAAMDDIAIRAGVSKPVLYQHFPGKQELYLALLDYHSAELEALVKDAIESSTENKARVYATVAAYYDFVEREGAPFRLLFESDLANEPVVGDRLESMFDRIAEDVAEAIAGDTTLSSEEAKLVGMALTGLAQVSARHWISRDVVLTKAEAVAVMGRLAWRGIAGFPSTHHVAE